ncbi:MAG TPA: zf-HC2 domain-containing protein, partial [Planctomycetota bacterium]|nr:zf-HC2 domain-containing protein [Planctomycetota bacterium]
MNTGDLMLQPPDPEDLRRYPPADESCLRIRGLLRDYADGELEPALRAAVDLHVHGCRACALALSRAEHEVWRLRRALAGESVAGAAAGAAAGSAESAGVPRGFPGRTVERLVRELSRATPSPAVLPVQPSAGAGSSVAGSSGTGSSVTSCNGAASRAFRMRRLLGYCTVVGAALAAMSLLLWRGYAEVDRTARAVVVAAEYARFGNGSQSVPAVPGEVLTEGATLTVAAGGHAELEWNDTEPRRQPAATLLLQGGSQVRIVEARPMLVDGAVEIDSQRRMVVATPDGATVELGHGVYHFDVVDYREFDAALREERSDLRVRLEVQAGDAARVVRAAGEARTVAGQVAQWHGWSATSIDGLPSPSSLANGIGAVRDPEPPASNPPALIGSVYVQPVGTPAVGARLLLWFLERGQQGLCATETDSAGTFRVPPDRSVEGDFVIAQLFPPPGRRDLGLRAPEAYPLLGTNQVRLQDPLVLQPTTDMNGRVMDRDQRPIANVRVLPCVVDELFGLLLP